MGCLLELLILSPTSSHRNCVSMEVEREKEREGEIDFVSFKMVENAKIVEGQTDWWWGLVGSMVNGVSAISKESTAHRFFSFFFFFFVNYLYIFFNIIFKRIKSFFFRLNILR